MITLPNTTLIVNGVDICKAYTIVLSDEYELSVPEPITYSVEIPGGETLDLTDAISSNVSFKNRLNKFVLYLIENGETFETVKTKLLNFLHGKKYDYIFTQDPNYTYTGRFKVTQASKSIGYTLNGYSLLGAITLEVDSEPWKLKKKMSFNVNAYGGKLFKFESGRKPVRPTIKVNNPTSICWEKGNITFDIGVGSFRLNKVLFEEGINELYINSCPLFAVIWDEIEETGEYKLTWDSAKAYRWDDIHRFKAGDNVEPQSWDDIAYNSWDSLASKEWRELNYKPSVGGSDVLLEYDWKDL